MDLLPIVRQIPPYRPFRRQSACVGRPRRRRPPLVGVCVSLDPGIYLNPGIPEIRGLDKSSCNDARDRRSNPASPPCERLPLATSPLAQRLESPWCLTPKKFPRIAKVRTAVERGARPAPLSPCARPDASRPAASRQ